MAHSVLQLLLAASILLAGTACAAQEAVEQERPPASEGVSASAEPEPAEAEDGAASAEARAGGEPYDIDTSADAAGVQACNDLRLGHLVLEAVGPSTLAAAQSVTGTVACVFQLPTETTDRIVLNLLEVSYEKDPAVPFDTAVSVFTEGGTELDIGDRAYAGSKSDGNMQVDVMLAEVDGGLVRVNGIFDATNPPPNWNLDTQEKLMRKAFESFIQ